ncbi:MAG: hypothetical protein COB30_015380 [Ectothiorhodospiraceae bacterium]|nr:hypothetical protein [Ectothiorhodospiraceae bacterium]
MKTVDYLDALKTRHSLASDYALAKFWGCDKQHISRYRKKGQTFDDTTALKVAKWLEMEPTKILLDMHAERSTLPEAKAAFERLSESLTGIAAAILLGFVVILGSIPAPVAAASKGAFCILC